MNSSPPSIGRDAIEDVVRSFMTAFLDLQVFLDSVQEQPGGAIHRCILTGTNTGPGGPGGPGGAGRPIRISGYEAWTFSERGLIARSRGHFDEADDQRKLAPES